MCMYGRAASVSMCVHVWESCKCEYVCACMGELQVRVCVYMYGRAASESMCVHVWESCKCEYVCMCQVRQTVNWSWDVRTKHNAHIANKDPFDGTQEQ